MKILLLFTALLLQQAVSAQQNVRISFLNDYKDVYHLSLILYTPDGKNQTRVSNLEPGQVKTYTLPAGTEVYVADWKQESFAMQGNDIKASGQKPDLVLGGDKKEIAITLSRFKKVAPQANK
ncbi:hypothetical protein SAMN05444008_12814 [Cnuella takakiae]|uniref:Uncharacterized protein n=1 Tax=Cnuella takakiae TaxID=1302690 RepID=A0A1M5J5B0_9BACT|nr:hypothetical protein [Cnuella takakiae]OLY91456.1 hypothetical protein BUE76_05730 [Cnuella takakiae]SHG35764.1 hypothetical protein SAMN05444008_12814 [Cnuella takakiae]